MSPSSPSLAHPFLPAAAFSEQGKYVSMVLAVVVHALLLMFLFYGVHWQTKVGEVVEVELVRAAEPAAEVLPQPPTPKQEAPTPRVEPKPEPKAVTPLPKPDIALKDKEKPKPKPKPAAKPEAPVDPFKKQAEQELKRTVDERKVAESASAVSKELSDLRKAQASAAKTKAIADYIDKIRGRIKSNIILPGDIKGNPEAVFDVVQFPSGEILSVRPKKTSGHPGYDAAVERAIWKSSPLPKPERGDLFERDLILKFHPLEE